jgi:Putative  PD-(D/E)XK family member, (DUF4420)
MNTRLDYLFQVIAPPENENPDKPIYAVIPVPDHQNYFVGKDRESHACLLVAGCDRPGRMQAPIRLENLDVQFDLRCQVRKEKEIERVGTFTVIRCRLLDTEIVRYFLSICETIVAMVGDRPAHRELASAVHRLAAIFQRMQKPPVRPVNGLFGELYLIWRSSNPSRALKAWRVDEAARFDFADGDVRLDVKAATGRVRAHTFSYEQCNPPPGTIAVVASLFVERVPNGISVGNLIQEIEARVAAYPDVVLKLHEVVAATLGGTLTEALGLTFDERLADSSLRFFDLRQVPGIRGALPGGVTDVHFRSDLSSAREVPLNLLINRAHNLQDLLPRH